MRAKICAVAVLGAVGSLPCVSAPAAEPYTIPAVLPLTGAAAFLGAGERKSLELVEKSVNAEGGINGQPIKFEFQDDQSSPQIGVQLANDVIAKKPAVMIGSSFVAVCRAMAPLMQDGPVDYCLSPGIHPEKGYVFTGNVSTLDDIDALLRFFRLKGWTKIAIMTSTDATGQDAENGIKSVLARPENKSMQLVDSEHFNITDVSVAAQIAHIKASGAQAMIAWSTGTPIATILRAYQDAGLTIPIEVSNGNLTYPQMHAYASFLPKDILFAGTPPIAADSIPNGPVKRKALEFLNDFKPTGQRPDTGYLAAWDPAAMIVDAYRKLGLNATAAQIREYLSNLRGWTGINGVYDFKAIPQRGIGPSSVVLVRWDPQKDTWVAVSKYGGEPLR